MNTNEMTTYPALKVLCTKEWSEDCISFKEAISRGLFVPPFKPSDVICSDTPFPETIGEVELMLAYINSACEMIDDQLSDENLRHGTDDQWIGRARGAKRAYARKAQLLKLRAGQIKSHRKDAAVPADIESRVKRLEVQVKKLEVQLEHQAETIAEELLVLYLSKDQEIVERKLINLYKRIKSSRSARGKKPGQDLTALIEDRFGSID